MLNQWVKVFQNCESIMDPDIVFILRNMVNR